MKIVHIITSLQTGGAEMMVAKLVASMDRTRFENVVVSLTVPGDVASQIEKSGVRVHSLAARNFIQAVWKVVRVLRRERPDVVQSWLPHADLVTTVACVLTGRRRFLWNIRNTRFDLSHYPRSVRWTLRLLPVLSPLPRAVISNSEAGRRDHQSLGFRPRRWVLIPNGFSLDRFRPMPGERNDARDERGIPRQAMVAAMVARYDPMKGYSIFLRAAAIVQRALPDAHFLLAGRGVAENAELRALAELLPGHVHFAGAVDDVARLYAAADIAVNCSTYGEAFSNAIGEAMACAVPCVVSDIGDSALIVADTGRIVAPNDVDGLAAAMIELLRMPAAARTALGAAARARIERDFSIDRITRSYETLYEEVAAANG